MRGKACYFISLHNFLLIMDHKIEKIGGVLDDIQKLATWFDLEIIYLELVDRDPETQYESQMLFLTPRKVYFVVLDGWIKS